MYSLSTTKKLLATAALIASFSIAANTQYQEQVETVDAAVVESTKVESPEIEITEIESTEVEIAEVEASEVEASEVEVAEVETSEVETSEVEVAEVEASEVEVSEVETASVDIAEVKIDTVQSSGVNTQTCPENFYQVKLPNNGKLCQVFAADLPASMIFFVPQLPEEVVAFYKQESTMLSTSRQVKDRVLLQSEDKNTTLIISTDGKGTQVDVLVKSSNS